jgi:hypothetical protein
MIDDRALTVLSSTMASSPIDSAPNPVVGSGTNCMMVDAVPRDPWCWIEVVACSTAGVDMFVGVLFGGTMDGVGWAVADAFFFSPLQCYKL